MFEFDERIIFPEDPTANPQRVAQYKDYYKVKYNILKNEKPEAKRILEIGVRAGYSAWTFLQACPDVEYVGLDANNGTHGGQGGEDGRFANWAKRILKEYNFHQYQCDTQKETDLSRFGKFDFIHIDGDHTVEGVMHDLDICSEILDESGVMLIDDYTYIKTVQQGVDTWLQNHKEFSHTFIPSLRGEIVIKPAKEKY